MVEIEVDISAITRKSAVIATEAKKLDTLDRVAGLREGNHIYLPPLSALDAIGTYCHEAGHILGDSLSFQAGLKPNTQVEVMSIDDVKRSSTTVCLTYDEIRYLRTWSSTNDIAPIAAAAISIANKILALFTYGKFRPNFVILHLVTQAQLDDLASEPGLTTLSRDNEDNLIAVNSKAGRNDEMPSILTEFCCLQILENTLKHYAIFSPDENIISGSASSPPHQRARNIIARAFKNKGWRPPSLKDLRQRPGQA